MTGTPSSLASGSRPQPGPTEQARLSALHRTGILDSEPEAAFDDLARLASQLCGTPMALVSLVDTDRQWFKSRVGVRARSTDRASSFCAHALHSDDLLVVPDAHCDARFVDNPLVTGEPWIRFYAGAPLTTDEGHRLGTLCVLDTVARALTPPQAEQLALLARQVVAQMILRQQARELHAANTLLRGVLDHADAAIYVKDTRGRFLVANPALQALVGRPLDGIVGQCTADVFDPDVAGELTRHDLRVLETGAHETFTEHLTDIDGVHHDFLSTKFPLRDDLGRAYGVAGVSTDVTELAEQRRMLSESERRWRALVEHSPVAVAVIDCRGNFAYANPNAVELYGGGSARDIVGRPSQVFVPEGDEADTAAMFRSVLGGAPVLGRRWKLRRLDGRIVDVEVNAAQVEREGEPAVQVELRDMTAQVEAERAREELTARWRALFTQSPVGVGVLDDRGVIIEANGALVATLRRPRAAIVGHAAAEFLHPGDRGVEDMVRRGVSAGSAEVTRTECRVVVPDGTTRWVWASLSRTLDPAGGTWTIAHVQDITDRKADEAALAESEANLRAVADVAQRIHDGSDSRQLIVDTALDLAGAAYVALVEPDPSLPVLRVTASTDPALVATTVSMSSTTATGEVYRSGAAMFLSDPRHHPLVSPALLELTGARTVYLVPIGGGEGVRAVLAVGWGRPLADLDDHRATVITLLAAQAGSALRLSDLLAASEGRATTDALTGLPNRRGWNTVLANAMSDASRSDKPLTVALADLDHFKSYNDRNGHAAGDALLVELAAHLRGALRRGDTAARWGGEEFAFVIADCAAAEGAEVLGRVLHGLPQGQTCSAGLVTWDRVDTPEQLLARADDALYRAKRAGRDRIVIGAGQGAAATPPAREGSGAPAAKLE